MEQEFIDSLLQNRVCVSLGIKGSGKSFLMLNFLKYALLHNLYKRYVLILPAFTFEQNDSYNFIDTSKSNIIVFEGYNETISSRLLVLQKAKKTRVKTLFIVDDASGESVWNLDPSLKKIITVIRHLDITLWMLVHSASGILSPFLRQNSDILLLSKLTNMKLLENIWEEYLSMTPKYHGKEGHKRFIEDFISLHESRYKVLYIDMRKDIIFNEAGNFNFAGKSISAKYNKVNNTN